MLTLWAAAMLLPLGIGQIQGGFLKENTEIALFLGSCCAVLVQIFWAVGTYLLLQDKQNAMAIVFAGVTVVAISALACTTALYTAFPEVFSVSQDLLALLIVSGVSLYFMMMAINAGKLSKTTLGSVGYFFLIFYWPFFLSTVREPLRRAFAVSAESRALARPQR